MMIASLALSVAALPGAHCANPSTQTEMTFCAYDSFRRADEALNAQWKIALVFNKKVDRDDPVPGPRDIRYADALLAAQRAWIAYRDAQCAVEGQAMRGGTGEPMIVYNCKAAMTRERTKWLAKMSQTN